MSDLKEAMDKLADLFYATGMDWSLTVHHSLTEPTCPTVIIQADGLDTTRYRMDCDTIEDGVKQAADRVYREVFLHEIIKPTAPFTNPNDQVLVSLLDAWSRGERPEPPGPEPGFREVDRYKLRRANATLRINAAHAANEITRLRAELAASAERIEDLDRVNEQSIVAMRHALDDLTPPEDDATEDQDFAAAHLRAAMDAAVSVSAATRAREAS